MPSFPSGRTLIVPGSQWWSRSGSAVALGAQSNYPAARLVNGSSATGTVSAFKTETFTVTTSNVTPNILGVIHHNIDRGNVCVFSSGGGLLRGAAARRPNFWLDLRGFPSTSTSWSVSINANSRPIMVGEIVVATGFEFDGTLRTAPAERVEFWQNRATMEYGEIAVSAHKAAQRRGQLDLSLTAAEVVQLEQVFYEAGLTGEAVIVVPNTLRNDIWFCRWPPRFDVGYRRSAVTDMEVTIDLVEESAGVVL